jgi:hypothetical protein
MNTFYIVDTAPDGGKLEIRYLPTEVNFKRDASVATIEVAGSNNAPLQWTGGQSSVSFTVGFYSEEEGRQDILQKVDWLESLTYADASGNVPAVLLVFGQMYEGFVFALRSVSTKFENFNRSVAAPIQAQVTLDFALDASSAPLDRNTIRNRNS